MIQGIDVALYFIGLDSAHKVFNKRKSVQDGRCFYVGCERLIHYMHMAQNIYIAKCGEPLMDSVFYAYDGGAVDRVVYDKYPELLECGNDGLPIDDNTKKYLDAIYHALHNTSLEELTILCQEDPEWADKYYQHSKNKQMDSMAHAAAYKTMYADMINVLERMN